MKIAYYHVVVQIERMLLDSGLPATPLLSPLWSLIFLPCSAYSYTPIQPLGPGKSPLVCLSLGFSPLPPSSTLLFLSSPPATARLTSDFFSLPSPILPDLELSIKLCSSFSLLQFASLCSQSFKAAPVWLAYCGALIICQRQVIGPGCKPFVVESHAADSSIRPVARCD